MPDARLVQRQALAGMLWSKQFYRYDVRRWLEGDPLQPAPPPERSHIRNTDWQHLNNRDIISMPDTWEYPWYASWDLAFHAVVFALIDPAFAKEQLLLLTHEWFMHPNGSLPAYEWAFGDVNPPVHAWAAWRVFRMDAGLTRHARLSSSWNEVFHKLMMNFTGWVNRQDVEGRNVFQGGFLGLDNIGVFDRSQKLPVAGRIDQSDGTSWMAMYALNMMRISLELAERNPVYEATATKFFEHFLAIAEAMTRRTAATACGMRRISSTTTCCSAPTVRRFRCACSRWSDCFRCSPSKFSNPRWSIGHPEFSPSGCSGCWTIGPISPPWCRTGRWRVRGRAVCLSLLRGSRMKALLRRMLDETAFLSHTACAACRGRISNIRSNCRSGRAAFQRRLRPRRQQQRGPSAAIPTGADRSGCR